MYEQEYKELKSQRVPGYIMIGIAIFVLVFFGSFCFGGMIRKIGKNETVEADRVTIEISYGDEDSSDTYKPTYYYTVGRKKYTYTPWYYTNIGVEDMKDTTLYYNSSDPSKVVPEYQTKFYWSSGFVIVFAGIFACIGLGILIGTIKKERKLKHLQEHGTLFRNLPCRVVQTNTYVNEEPVIKIEIDYVGPDGELIVFSQKKIGDYDEEVQTADLLVDQNDLSMYYIDFNIEQ
ncbi:MAG: DUF3592 domain-containing protein [Clostridia bacterium]|nr:DUF3592 domain-containing protein [Clostridia bacterium]